MPFTKGQVANPNGRPRKAKDIWANYETLIEPEKEKLFKKVFEMALEGDKDMLRFLLSPFVPKKPKDELEEELVKAQIKALSIKTEVDEAFLEKVMVMWNERDQQKEKVKNEQ